MLARQPLGIATSSPEVLCVYAVRSSTGVNGHARLLGVQARLSVRRQRRFGALWLLVMCVCAVTVGTGFSAPQAAGQALPPSFLPGPPPGARSGFPLPPPPGRAPDAEPAGPAATLPAQVSGPALLSGSVDLRGTRFAVQIACRTGGLMNVTARSVGTGILASASYVCRNRRATARVSLTKAAAKRMAGRGSTIAQLIFVQGKTTTQRLSLTVEVRPQAPAYWSDGGLRCNPSVSYEGEMVAPNFRVTPRTTIDVRPWLAWYTSANGWRWLGVNGINASRWYRWTATPDGVAEWRTPTGTISPWMWTPIGVPAGQGTYAVSVFEVIYWYSRPVYVWRYAPSSPSLNVTTTYCNYP